MAEKKFPTGIYAKVVSTQHGIITKISVKKKAFIEYLQSLDENEEYLNLDVLKSQNPEAKNPFYIVVDEWKPKPKDVDTTSNTSNDLFDMPEKA